MIRRKTILDPWRGFKSGNLQEEITMIKWLFFDLGSTLIDESDCIDFRVRETLKQSGAPDKDAFERRMIELAKQNRLPYKDAVKEYGLEIIKWPKHLEKIYDGVPELLKSLKNGYKIGTIANQSAGTEQRLTEYGIRRYFDLIVSSAEEGLEKPDPRIFMLALDKAGCRPEEAYMIGDRLDNDIEPAGKIGMKTIWVRQSSFAYGNPELIEHKPDYIVDNILSVSDKFI